MQIGFVQDRAILNVIFYLIVFDFCALERVCIAGGTDGGAGFVMLRDAS